MSGAETWGPMVLPLEVETLRSAVEGGQTFSYRFFWGHHGRPGKLSDTCFSQWWPSPFALGEHRYATAEHFMMAAKARLFGDHAIAEQIVSGTDPREAKSLGRRVANFSAPKWAALRFDIVTLGSFAKFSQSPDLRSYLLETQDDVLVEASPTDAVWGIGLAASDAAARDPGSWRGLNLLGFALVRARAILRGQLPEVDLERLGEVLSP